jgi:branched-subunit amino acid aminotransferase/4-amino-4-deoxychorismate lyase
VSGNDPATVPTDDRGLLLGDGIFETIRLYGGRPFRLEQHLARMEASAKVLGIPVPSQMRHRVDRELESLGEFEGALRITITRGSGAGLSPPREPESRLIVGVRGLHLDGSWEKGGIRARLYGRLDERSLTAGHKVIGNLERIQALRLAIDAGADEALLRNGLDRIVEGSASNFFGVRGDVLMAPGPREGALPGITREVLLDIARRKGHPVKEHGIEFEELHTCTEIFLSSSVREIVAVTEVDGVKVGEGRPGPVFAKLANEFGEVIRREVAG